MKKILIISISLILLLPSIYLGSLVIDKFNFVSSSIEKNHDVYSSNNVTTTKMINQKSLVNEKIKDYDFLTCMYNDSYFPTFLVDKCKNILLELCQNIENQNPENLEELYSLTHSSTNKLNNLENEFGENESEIESAARDCLAQDFEFIAKAYGFNADVEELIATRNW